jgi:hypothetical protein
MLSKLLSCKLHAAGLIDCQITPDNRRALNQSLEPNGNSYAASFLRVFWLDVQDHLILASKGWKQRLVIQSPLVEKKLKTKRDKDAKII